MSDYLSTVSQPSGRHFIGYLTRNSDSFIYNVSSGAFDGVILADLVGNARVPYRIAYTEGAPGSYTATVDLTNFVDDEYTLVVREIANNVEYSVISKDVFTVSSGEVSSTDIYVKITTAPTRTLFAYIMSSSSGLFYKATDFTLQALDLTLDSIDKRAQFRHSYNEPAPSDYILSVDASNLPDDTYIIKTYELVGDIEIEAGEDFLIKVQDGKRLSGVDFGTVALSDSTGGKDNLRYVEQGGNPVGGAVVTVYLANEYNQGNTANPLGKTNTDPSGRWIDPISVDAGITYTVVFQKRGLFGPDSVEVVV